MTGEHHLHPPDTARIERSWWFRILKWVLIVAFGAMIVNGVEGILHYSKKSYDQQIVDHLTLQSMVEGQTDTANDLRQLREKQDALLSSVRANQQNIQFLNERMARIDGLGAYPQPAHETNSRDRKRGHR